MNDNAPQEEDLFVLANDLDHYLLYAPLRRTVVTLNGSAVAAVKRYLGRHALDPRDSEVIEQLRTVGLFRSPFPVPPIAPSNYVFRPHEVTLFPTSRCNLQCIYCYAEAGSHSTDMPWEIAKAAIDVVVDNAKAVGRDDFILGFHGGGEPTLAWGLVEQATLYAYERAGQTGLKTRVHAASNGVLTERQQKFITEHFTGINISLDGPADLQNRQRPLARGGGSSASVMDTIDFFRAAKFPYGIRATLTQAGAPRLVEIVRYIHERCPELDQLHVEPVWFCGRCRTSGEHPPEEGDFIRHFLDAQDEARRLGFSLFYSGARLDTLTNKFCAAPGDGFSVTPEGLVTSCFEITDARDPRASLFHYGYFDRGSGVFVFDEAKIRALRRLCVENIAHCRDCFCKWHCAGDCLAKALPDGTPDSHAGSPRCSLNRQISLAELRRTVSQAGPENREVSIHGSTTG